MTTEEFIAEVRALADSDGPVEPEDRLETLGLDSLARFELALLVEDTFHSHLLRQPSFDWDNTTIRQLMEAARRTAQPPNFRLTGAPGGS